MGRMNPVSSKAVEDLLRGLPWVAEARVWWPEPQVRPRAAIWPRMEKIRQEGWVNLFEALRFRLENEVLALPPLARPSAWTIVRAPEAPPPGSDAAPAWLGELGDPPPRVYPRHPGGEPVPAAWDAALRHSRMVPEGVSALTRNTSLEFDLGLDSLDRLSLILALGEASSRACREEEWLSFYTLGDLIDAWGPLPAPSARPSPRPELVMAWPRKGGSRRPWGLWPLVLAVRWGLHWRLLRKMDLEGAGVEWVAKEKGPLVIAQNHQSNIDPVLVSGVLPPRLHRRLFFLGFTGYFNRGLGAWAARLFDIHPISADQGALSGLRGAAAAVKRGRILLIYPEGERSWDGSLRPFRRGVAWIAREAGARVIPSAVAGAYQAWPRGGKLQPCPVRVAFGPPLDPPRPEEGPAGEAAFLDRLRAEIALLMRRLGEDPERGHPEVWAALGGGTVAPRPGRD